MRLLLTSAGRRAELLQCFRASAAELDIDLHIIACDANPEWSAACRLADTRVAVPPVTDEGYIEALLDICRSGDVSLVVPTIDPELLPLSRARERFAEIGARAVVSAPEVVEMARDKLMTARFLTAHRIPAPRTATTETVRHEPGDWQWPLIVKARHGSASRGLRIVQGPVQLGSADEGEPLVAQELLQGGEYTVNLFFDDRGDLLAAVPHERVQVRAGEVEKGVTSRLPVLMNLAEALAEALPDARGPLCFQAMVDEAGHASVFEINARFGGGFPLAYQAGAPFTRWLLEESLGKQPSAGRAWREGMVMLRYDAAVFIKP